jgi:hypothetical protein
VLGSGVVSTHEAERLGGRYAVLLKALQSLIDALPTRPARRRQVGFGAATRRTGLKPGTWNPKPKPDRAVNDFAQLNAALDDGEPSTKEH